MHQNNPCRGMVVKITIIRLLILVIEQNFPRCFLFSLWKCIIRRFINIWIINLTWCFQIEISHITFVLIRHRGRRPMYSHAHTLWKVNVHKTECKYRALASEWMDGHCWPLDINSRKQSERASSTTNHLAACLLCSCCWVIQRASEFLMTGARNPRVKGIYVCMETHIYSGPLSLILSDCVCMWCWECESVLFACLLNSYTASLGAHTHTPGRFSAVGKIPASACSAAVVSGAELCSGEMPWCCAMCSK